MKRFHLRQARSLRWLVALALCAALGGGVCGVASTRAQGTDTLTTLYSFDAASTGPSASTTPALIQGGDGCFYGTTSGNNTPAGADGAVYRLTPGGVLTTLHGFNGADGAHPAGRLIQGADGNFYGTTGGGENGGSPGTIYRLTPDGVLTTLYRFVAGSDGYGYPPSGIVQGRDGNLYGVTSHGGPNGLGTFYRVTPDGTFTVLYQFDGGAGYYPNTTPILGSDGNFYGTTSFYGNHFGAVYRLTPDGAATLLHAFADIGGGTNPVGLLQGSDGAFYGTTFGGGADDGAGTVFRLGLDGAFALLHTFGRSPEGYAPDGVSPVTGLTQDPAGNLYGTTSDGTENDGTAISGTVFRLTPDGTLTTLHKFTHTYVGGGPVATLLLGGDGALYGLTPYGGVNALGSVFRVTTDSVAPTVPVPPVSTLPVLNVGVVVSYNLADTQRGGYSLNLSRPLATDLQVAYSVGGSGRPGVDYVALKGVAKIKAGKVDKVINLRPIAIPHVAGVKPTVRTVKLTMLPSDEYQFGTVPSLKVKITHP